MVQKILEENEKIVESKKFLSLPFYGRTMS